MSRTVREKLPDYIVLPQALLFPAWGLSVLAGFVWGAGTWAWIGPLWAGGCLVAGSHGYGRVVGVRMAERQFARVAARLPKEMHVMPLSDDDDHQVITITMDNGDISSITVPRDYHPSQDNGELLLREILGADYEGDVQMHTVMQQFFGRGMQG